jgi:hypothetical protein
VLDVAQRIDFRSAAYAGWIAEKAKTAASAATNAEKKYPALVFAIVFLL